MAKTKALISCAVTDQLCSYCTADLRLFFSKTKICFSHDAVQNNNLVMVCIVQYDISFCSFTSCTHVILHFPQLRIPMMLVHMYFDLMEYGIDIGLASTDNASLTKITYNNKFRNFGDEFAFTHSKDFFILLSSLIFVTYI